MQLMLMKGFIVYIEWNLCNTDTKLVEWAVCNNRGARVMEVSTRKGFTVYILQLLLFSRLYFKVQMTLLAGQLNYSRRHSHL